MYKIQQESLQEIVDYLKSGKLFQKEPDRHAIEQIPAYLIDSLDDIDLYREPHLKGAKITDPLSWIDIIEESGIERSLATRGWRPADYSAFDDYMRSLFSTVWEKNVEVVDKSKDFFGEQLSGELGGFVDVMLTQRAVCGVLSEHFLEKCWRIITLGGVPCGWIGGEDGMLVVYVPPDQ